MISRTLGPFVLNFSTWISMFSMYIILDYCY